MAVRFGSKNILFRRYSYLAPYAVIFVLIGYVGLRLTNASSAAPLQAADVAITVSKPSYRTDEVVKFAITNYTGKTISVINNCPDVPLEVSRLVGKNWQRIHEMVDVSKCRNEPRSYTISPHASISATYRYWPEAFTNPGHYRIVAPLEQYDLRPTVEFDIVAAQ